MSKKKTRKWRVVSFSILGILLLAAAAFGFEYYKLQPKNHFTAVPVVGKGSTTEKMKDPIFNVLLIGSDQRKGEKLGHTDSLILVHVDLKKYKYNVVSIPRDTRVFLKGRGYTKITSVQYIEQATKGTKQGIESSVEAVSNLTGVPINYYAETNYQGFQSMVDALGGIDMDVPFNVTLTAPWYKENKNKVITAGTHSLDGKMVAEVVHERHSLPTGDNGRQKLQEEALKAIAKKALEPTNIGNLPALAKSIPDFLVATNMSPSDMVSLGLAAKNFNPATQLTYHQIPGDGKRLYDDVLKANNYQLVLNPEKLKEVISTNFE